MGSRARVDQSRDCTLSPTIEEVCVPSITSIVTLSEDKRIWLDLVPNLVDVEGVFNEDVWESSRVV